jgi:hypothetical protein
VISSSSSRRTLFSGPFLVARCCVNGSSFGFIEFGEDGLGRLGFIVVTGELDCRDADSDGQPGIEFSWQGSDEGDDASGRGWAALNPDGTLEGHIYFHLGDDSGFRAERFNEAVQ